MSATFTEDARVLPLVQTCDVLVAGGGPAGFAAALAAARGGARVTLLEAQGCLGGVWTSGLLAWVLDSSGKPGVMAELIAELDRRDARFLKKPGDLDYAHDPEVMKLLLEELLLAAGVRIRLHTRVCAAARDSAGRLAVAITESKSGREAWAAGCFIDATGDGDFAARAGCGFDLGREKTGDCQPMSMLGLVGGVRLRDIEPFVLGPMRERKARLRAEFQRGGADPSYTSPSLFPIRENLFALMANHEYGVSALDADQITAATLRARAEVNRLVDALRRVGGPWSGLRLVATASHIGVREGRRIHGRYTVSEADLRTGARHEDAVCRVHFGIDVHATKAAHGGSYDPANKDKGQPYDIPLRALIARDVDGLLLAGRCISGDFLAHSSYRVTGNAVAMGEAAGRVAARAALSGRLPHQVAWSEVAPAAPAPVPAAAVA